jgi:hypothetical protein
MSEGANPQHLGRCKHHMKCLTCVLAILSTAFTACVGQDSPQIRSATDSAQRQIRPGMSVADVVDVAAAQDRPFSVSGSCGPEGALSVGGDGKDLSLSS